MVDLNYSIGDYNMRTPIGFWVLVLIIIITDWDSTGKWLTFLFSFMALIVLVLYIHKIISLIKEDFKKSAEIIRRMRKERREREEQRKRGIEINRD